ncbi:intraflagellar transport protein 27 homolog [Octopus bimaculoides]|uniref:Small monomeric GTPase n=1 Tax=Octopus bimaculoides TaxID=37653 RepID=A0A0L8GVT6_OCTBM|nr:intraflagellar transport protein 27 homolog [Octopus bimaculoides]|eukprot:XP_014777678.1 PREDICTED: intraflagellar transport protein 27 homolog isoform X1 [Octopus bimaculoides]
MTTVLHAKCFLLGSSAVGKTSLCQTFHNDGTNLSKNYNMTTNVDIVVKSVRVPGTRYSVEFIMFDTPSKDCYSEFVQNFYSNASLVIALYDITDTKSFEECNNYLEQILKRNPKGSVICFVVGNKTDLEEQRKISKEEGEGLARKYDAEFCECSVKDMVNIDNPFQHLALSFTKKYEASLEHFSSLT